jgi:hypothetical protein
MSHARTDIVNLIPLVESAKSLLLGQIDDLVLEKRAIKKEIRDNWEKRSRLYKSFVSFESFQRGELDKALRMDEICWGIDRKEKLVKRLDALFNLANLSADGCVSLSVDDSRMIDKIIESA